MFIVCNVTQLAKPKMAARGLQNGRRGLEMNLFLYFWVRNIDDREKMTATAVSRLSSIKGHLKSKAVFHQRSSSIKGHLSSKVVFH